MNPWQTGMPMAPNMNQKMPQIPMMNTGQQFPSKK